MVRSPVFIATNRTSSEVGDNGTSSVTKQLQQQQQKKQHIGKMAISKVQDEFSSSEDELEDIPLKGLIKEVTSKRIRLRSNDKAKPTDQSPGGNTSETAESGEVLFESTTSKSQQQQQQQQLLPPSRNKVPRALRKMPSNSPTRTTVTTTTTNNHRSPVTVCGSSAVLSPSKTIAPSSTVVSSFAYIKSPISKGGEKNSINITTKDKESGGGIGRGGDGGASVSVVKVARPVRDVPVSCGDADDAGGMLPPKSKDDRLRR